MKISVEDTGIGISPHQLPHIFNMFDRVSHTSAINPQGCGLGLGISSMLVSKLGGSQIFVESKVNVGSTFWFLVPVGLCGERKDSYLREAEDEDIPDEFLFGPKLHSPHGEVVDFEQADVLIVDDSPFNRMVIRRVLDTSGFTNTEASTGLQALQLTRVASDRGLPFSIIIMDVEMPEMDGIQATREIRRLTERGEILKPPVIIGCSAYCSDEDKSLGLSAGMNYYIEKPVSRHELLNLISTFL